MEFQPVRRTRSTKCKECRDPIFTDCSDCNKICEKVWKCPKCLNIHPHETLYPISE